MPTITCIMPAYNAEKYVKEAIESILNQTYNDFEFIIIDDGSKDDTPNIIEEYANKDERIVYLANEENKGISYTRNRGLATAKGKYIAIMDADDVAEYERFEKQIEYMENNEDIGVLGAAARMINEDANESNTIGRPAEDREIKLYALHSSPVINPTAMIRKTIIDENNLRYDEEYNGAEDYEFWQRMSKITKFHNLPEVLMRCREEKKDDKAYGATFKVMNRALKEMVNEEFYIPLFENPEDMSPAAILETFRVISEISLMILKEDCPFTRGELTTVAISQRAYLLDIVFKDSEEKEE